MEPTQRVKKSVSVALAGLAEVVHMGLVVRRTRTLSYDLPHRAGQRLVAFLQRGDGNVARIHDLQPSGHEKRVRQ